MIKLTVAMMVLATLFLVTFAVGRVELFLGSYGWVMYSPNTPQQEIGAFLYTVYSSASPYLYVIFLSSYRARAVRSLFRHLPFLNHLRFLLELQCRE